MRTLLTTEGGDKGTEVPDYVTESGRVEQLPSRPKTGGPQDHTELGIYDRQHDTVYIVDVKQIPGIYDKPAFLKEYHTDTLPFEEKYKDPRPVVFSGPVFSEDGKAAVVVRSQDNKDRWIALPDLPTGGGENPR